MRDDSTPSKDEQAAQKEAAEAERKARRTRQPLIAVHPKSQSSNRSGLSGFVLDHALDRTGRRNAPWQD